MKDNVRFAYFPSFVPLLLSALVLSSGCNETTPCDGIEGTCLNLYLSGGTEEVEEVRFQLEGDGNFRKSSTFTPAGGKQRLPLLTALPLPPEAERVVKVAADALRGGQVILRGQKTVADLLSGTHRTITIRLESTGAGGPPSCQNGVQDGSETDVDCGGLCAPCDPGCNDGVKNNDETDVDCGGFCSRCLAGKTCGGAADCASDRCEAGKCSMGLGISAIVPASGPTLGGGEVILRGELFEPTMSVQIGGAQATLSRVEADGRSALVTLPPGMAGRADVAVRVGAQSAVRKGLFGYYFGDLQFGEMLPVTYPTGGKPYFVVSGQINKRQDLFSDILVLNEASGDLSVYLGKGDGSFRALAPHPATASLPIQVKLGDLNGDGNLDCVTANHRFPSVSVYLGRGDGTLNSGNEYQLPTSTGMKAFPITLALADFNGDMLDDVAVAEYENMGGLYVLLARSDRSGTLLSPLPMTGLSLSARDPEPSLVAGKFNNDGFQDLAIALKGQRIVRVFLGKGDGTFTQGGDFAIGVTGTPSLEASDMDGDRRIDLVVAGRESGQVAVLLGRGDGTFGRARLASAGPTPFAIALGDLDGDGLLDVAVPNWMGEFMGLARATLLFSDGGGRFPRSLSLGIPREPYGVTVADYDGDGKMDVATVSPTANVLGVYLNKSR